VIAPTADPEVAALAADQRIEWLARSYRPGDLAGAAIVFAATRNPEVHAQIWAEGLDNNQLVNVMDVVDKCNFHGASFLRRGLLTIAIGTGGAAPALAVTLRKRFEHEFGPEYAAFLEFSRALRPAVSRRIPSFVRRQRFWYAFVESDALALLAAGREAEVCGLAENLLNEYAQHNTEGSNHHEHAFAPALETA
jgi:siroheme synthase-like protein